MSLELNDISFAHPGSTHDSRPLLDHVNLKVAAGEVVGLVGSSGSGKSTLLRIAALMTATNTGTVSINNNTFAPGAQIPVEARRSIGVVLQTPRAAADPKLRLESLICAPMDFRDGALRPRPRRHHERLLQLTELVRLSPTLLRHFPHQVSDGQLQRALIARALALDPQVLIFDEPTAQLDAETTGIILQVIEERAAHGAAVMIASHDVAALSTLTTRMIELAKLNRSTAHLVEQQP